jgi:hypothetical protein
MYYSRMKIVLKLLPLLLKSSLPARVISVYAAGTEAKLFPDDLSVRNLSRYSYSQARSHMIYMHTLFMESLAEQHPGKLALIHIFPGIVFGPGYNNPELPLWFRRLARWVLIPLLGPLVAVPPAECGDRMLSLASPRYPPRPSSVDDRPASVKTARQPKNGKGEEEGSAVMLGTNGQPGSGVYSLTWNGENNLKQKAYRKFDKDEMRKRVWDHTTAAFEAIEAGQVFTG